MQKTDHDLVVIGAGPGGYVAALRAAQLGLDVACVEREQALGGTCLRIGCIPSKALIESSERFAMARRDLKRHGVMASGVDLDLGRMLGRKDRIVNGLTRGIKGLFERGGVTRYLGTGRLDGPGRVMVGSDEPACIEAKHIIIATGSRPASLKGVEFRGPVGTSTEALSYDAVPGHMVVIGAGAIGLELGSVWRRLGAKVTVIEFLDRILPGTDLDIASTAVRAFKRQGLKFLLGARVLGTRVDGDCAIVDVEDMDPVPADRVLVAVGRIPVTEDLGLETVGVETDEKGFIPVGEGLATSAQGVYAVGDVTGGAMLAHKAHEEGVVCVERIVTGHGRVNYDAIPAIAYTDPEVASVGRTEDALKEAGVEYRKGSFPFMANGRARALGGTEGEVKVLAHAGTDRILGVHILGPRAGDLIAEATAAMELGATSEDLARTCHAHPTLSEALKEAALDVHDRAIHI